MKTLITSAAFVGTELAAELGTLPPSFLPLGNKRLIFHQVESLKLTNDDQLYLSLPESFALEQVDKLNLQKLKINIIRVPDNIRLGNSVLHCLRLMGADGALRILHGDTLLEANDLALNLDSWLVSSPKNSYYWGVAYITNGQIVGIDSSVATELKGNTNGAQANILVGYFVFSNAKYFINALQYSNGDFLTALARYAATHKVAAIHSRTWKDLGHLQTFYEARSDFASARNFNELRIGEGIVQKSSVQSSKLKAEASWLKNIPPKLKIYTGRLIDESYLSENGYQYKTEYEALPTLQELFVFGNLSQHSWLYIMKSCFSCLKAFAAEGNGIEERETLIRLGIEKTEERLNHFEAKTDINLSLPTRLNGVNLLSPRKIARKMYDIISNAESRQSCVMHGDFCFSNILFNSRLGRIRLIDPRGMIDGDLTIMGDIRYDMAKLAHSVLGKYDLIVTNRYTLDYNFSKELNFELDFPVSCKQIMSKEDFWNQEIDGVKFGDQVVKAILVLLFLSMLPLHADKPLRQIAFLANAVRIYYEEFTDKK